MMISGREKQAEDRQATEDVLDAMTQYGVEPKEKLVESQGRAKGNGTT